MLPTQQAYFLQLASLNKRSLTLYQDLCTTWPNIAYLVLKHDKDEANTTLQEIVDNRRGHYRLDAQIVVYCPSWEETCRLGRLLQCPAFTSDKGTAKDKAR
jgi:hypothetical protein